MLGNYAFMYTTHLLLLKLKGLWLLHCDWLEGRERYNRFLQYILGYKCVGNKWDFVTVSTHNICHRRGLANLFSTKLENGWSFNIQQCERYHELQYFGQTTDKYHTSSDGHFPNSSKVVKLIDPLA